LKKGESILGEAEGGESHMPAPIEIAQAQTSLYQDFDTTRVFKFILQKSAAPGWMIVKELGQDTATTKASLVKLRNLGLLEASGDGLDGFYHSTSLGYALNEIL
jgi:hypothetical protein